MTTAVSAVEVLREAARRLRALRRQLVEDGPLRLPLATARAPEVWAGPLQRAFVGYLELQEGFLESRVAPAIDVVAGWLERRAAELDAHQPILPAGVAGPAPPAPPAPLSVQDPGRPGPYALPPSAAGEFVGLNPTAVRRLASQLANAAAATYAFGAHLRAALSDVEHLAPRNASGVAGIDALAELSASLQDAVRDLHQRARTVEEDQRAELPDRAFGIFETGVLRTATTRAQLPWLAEKVQKLQAGERLFDSRAWIRSAKHPLRTFRADLQGLATAKTPEEMIKHTGKVGTKTLKGFEIIVKGKQDGSAAKTSAPPNGSSTPPGAA